MNIKTMKHAAKKAARNDGTSYQEELNRIARKSGFTHWGALLAMQPNPSYAYRHYHIHQQNAQDLQQARNDRVHILYVAEDLQTAIDHVLGMIATIALLPPPDVEDGTGAITRPAELAITCDDEQDWKDMRRITPGAISKMPNGSVVIVHQMRWEYVEAARGRGIMLIGATTPDLAASWPKDDDDPFLTLFITPQDTSQLGRLYTKEDRDIIYATRGVKYILPEKHEETVSVAQGEAGATTIQRMSASQPITRRYPSTRPAGDYVRPGDIAKQHARRTN